MKRFSVKLESIKPEDVWEDNEGWKRPKYELLFHIENHKINFLDLFDFLDGQTFFIVKHIDGEFEDGCRVHISTDHEHIRKTTEFVLGVIQKLQKIASSKGTKNLEREISKDFNRILKGMKVNVSSVK